METKRNVWLWVLYDFANSIVSIVFFLYFAQWIVVDEHVPDIWFNLTFTAAALLLLFTAPLAGYRLDGVLRRLTGIRYTTIFTALFYGMCAFSALVGNDVNALVFFTLGLYMYLLSFTFYTPLLNDITSAERRGKVSGMGIAANYLGQFTGLLLVLPFASGAVNMFAASPRAETLLPATIGFFVLALPMMLFFQEPAKKEGHIPTIAQSVRGLFRETKTILVYPGVLLFLSAYFLFNDALLTTLNNFPIYLDQVWSLSDTAKTYLLMGILVTSALGGWVGGRIADRKGHKRTLIWIIAGWIVIMPVLALLRDLPAFVVIAVAMGLWFGGTWAVSRSVMSYLAPSGKHNLSFAYFSLVERASSFIGPVVWGLTVTDLVSLGSDRYRIAVLVVTAFIVVGLLVLAVVRSDRK